MTDWLSLRVVGLIAGIVLSGCTHVLDLIPAEKDLARLSGPVTQGILRAVHEREAAVTSLHAVLDLTVRRKETREYRQEVIAIERPDLIRWESIGWGGVTSLVVVSDGRRFGAHALLQNIFIEGNATPDNVAAVTGLRVAPAHLVRLLLGLPPIPVQIEHTALYGPDDDHAYLLREQESSFTQRLWLSDDGLSLLRGELYDGKVLRLRFRYAPSGHRGRVLFLDEPLQQLTVEISYRSHTINPDLPRELFRIPQPVQGARVVNLDAELAPLSTLP